MTWIRIAAVASALIYPTLLLCMAAALMGRDTWRWGTISVIAGSVLLIVGAIMNRQYLKEVLLFRGAARRGEGKEKQRLNQTPPKSTRIR